MEDNNYWKVVMDSENPYTCTHILHIDGSTFASTVLTREFEPDNPDDLIKLKLEYIEARNRYKLSNRYKSSNLSEDSQNKLDKYFKDQEYQFDLYKVR